MSKIQDLTLWLQMSKIQDLTLWLLPGLALYVGMATLDNSSGKKKGAKRPKQVNERAKAAMMTAVDRHRKQVPQSQAYYQKKRLEGKTHNQAVRALGRHICRVIFKMLKENRGYISPH